MKKHGTVRKNQHGRLRLGEIVEYRWIPCGNCKRFPEYGFSVQTIGSSREEKIHERRGHVIRLTVLRAANRVLRAGAVASARLRGLVAMNPKSRGGEVEGTIGMVYSTPMKNKSENAKAQSTGWRLATPAGPSSDHPAKDGPWGGSSGTGGGEGVPILLPSFTPGDEGSGGGRRGSISLPWSWLAMPRVTLVPSAAFLCTQRWVLLPPFSAVMVGHGGRDQPLLSDL